MMSQEEERDYGDFEDLARKLGALSSAGLTVKGLTHAAPRIPKPRKIDLSSAAGYSERLAERKEKRRKERASRIRLVIFAPLAVLGSAIIWTQALSFGSNWNWVFIGALLIMPLLAEVLERMERR